MEPHRSSSYFKKSIPVSASMTKKTIENMISDVRNEIWPQDLDLILNNKDLCMTIDETLDTRQLFFIARVDDPYFADVAKPEHIQRTTRQTSN